MSDSIRTTGQTRGFQFRLSYLLYLLTLAALAFAGLRRVFEIQGGWQLNASLSVVFGALLAYFAIRFPILIRRLMRRNREIAVRRSEMKRFADSAIARREESKKDSSPL